MNSQAVVAALYAGGHDARALEAIAVGVEKESLVDFTLFGKGWVRENAVVCPYHGWRFAGDGVAVAKYRRLPVAHGLRNGRSGEQALIAGEHANRDGRGAGSDVQSETGMSLRTEFMTRKRFLYQLLAFVIECTRRFIKDKNIRITEKRACNRKSLLFSS